MKANRNYEAIRRDRQLPELAALTAKKFAEARNAKTHERLEDVLMVDVLNHLIKVNPVTQVAVYDKLETASLDTAYPYVLRRAISRLLVTVKSNIPYLNFSSAELISYLPYVVMLGIVTQGEADAFLSLSRVLYSDADVEYGGEIDATDVAIADLLPKLALVRAKQEEALTTYNDEIARLNTLQTQLEQGIDVPETPTANAYIDNWSVQGAATPYEVTALDILDNGLPVLPNVTAPTPVVSNWSDD